jgi:hypothetical protein
MVKNYLESIKGFTKKETQEKKVFTRYLQISFPTLQRTFRVSMLMCKYFPKRPRQAILTYEYGKEITKLLAMSR